MKKVLKQLTAVFTGAIMASALILPIYAAEISLLQTTNGKAVENVSLKKENLSKYNSFFKAIGATDSQIREMYLAGRIRMKVGETVELHLLQPARSKNANAALSLLVGKQAAVSVTGPSDGKTIKNSNGEYLPLTFTGKANGTDLYIANLEPYGICAYEFIVGSGKGVTNTNPKLYWDEVASADTSAVDYEDVKTINYNPSPLGVALSTQGSSLLSQGGVKIAGKQVNGIMLNGHALYSPSAVVNSAPKSTLLGMLNEEEIITVNNAGVRAAKKAPEPTRLGLLNEEQIITISNTGAQATTEAPAPTRLGLLNEEQIITISNTGAQATTEAPAPTRLGLLNEEQIITISNTGAQATTEAPAPTRLGLLNEEQIITISNTGAQATTEAPAPTRLGLLNEEQIITIN